MMATELGLLEAFDGTGDCDLLGGKRLSQKFPKIGETGSPGAWSAGKLVSIRISNFDRETLSGTPRVLRLP